MLRLNAIQTPQTATDIHLQAVKTIEISSDGNTWYPTTRETYNFFTAGTIPGATLSVRVTSDASDVVVVQGVDVSGGTYNAGNNF